MDSDVDDLENTENWRVFGESVRLENNQKLLINKGELGTAISGISRNPAIARWIGDQPHLQQILKDTGKTPGAGQIRRRGRFLFAHSAREFATQVGNEVRRLTEGASASVSFHVCCTLAAGTGSGSIIDALACLRRGRDAPSYPIYVYALITDSQVGDIDTGNFYANQYAALSELNAYMLNDYDPHNVAGSGERVEDIRDRVQACYLITDINRENISSSREDQEEMIAEYLYNRIVAFKDVLPANFSKSWTYQDVSQYAGEGGRSYRFGSIGVKRWAIPEAEIREKLALGFVQSAVRQSLYNHWQHDFGFLDKPIPMDVVEIPIDSLQRWYLGEEQAVLNKDFELDGHVGTVPPWDEEWARIVNYCVRQVQQEKATDKDGWLREIESRVLSHVEKHFRDRGVANYYNERVEAVADYARRSMDAIEKELYAAWRRGTYGLHDVQRVLEQLRKELARGAKLVDDDEIVEADKVITEGERFLRNARMEWAKVRWLSEFLFKTRTRQLESFAAGLRQYCYYRTLRQALLFKKALFEEVVKLVDGLNGTVTRIAHQFRELGTKVGEEAKLRCVEGGEGRFDEPLVREYSPRAINDIIRSLLLREPVQHTHAGAVRKSLEEALGADPSLTSLEKYMARQPVRELIEAQSFASSAAQHSHEVAAGAEPVFNVSIVEKLREKYSGNSEALRNDVEGFMRKSATAFLIDDNQESPGTVEGREGMPFMPIRRMVVFLPGADRAGDPFVRDIKERFSRAVAGVTVDVEDSDRQHEIAVLAADYWMAARFVSGL